MESKSILKKLYTEKNFILISLVMMVLLFSLPVIRSGVYLGHDLIFHLGRIQEIALELKGGQFPVRYEHEAWYGYGYISSTMYPHTFLYIPALLYLTGVPLYRAYNIYVLLVNVITVFLSYYSFNKLFKDCKWGLLATLIYSFSAYRFSNVYQRAAVGEYTAMAFIPFLVYGVYKIYFEEKNESVFKRISPVVIATFGILQSHVLTTEMLAIAVLFFAIVYLKRTLIVIKDLILCVLFILFSNAFYLIPFLQTYSTEHMAINTTIPELGVHGEGLYLSQLFKPFSEGRGADLAWSPDHEEFLALGISMVICVFVTVIMIALHKRIVEDNQVKDDFKAVLYILLLGLMAAYVSTIYFPWENLKTDSVIGKLLIAVQFPWRYLLIQSLCFSISGVFSFKTLIKKNSIYFIVLTIFGIIAIAQTGVFFHYLSYSNETFTANYIDGWPGEADSLYLLVGTEQDNIEKNNDVVFEANTAILPKFGYKNTVVIDEKTGENIQWKLGDNNRIAISSSDYSENINVEFVPPLTWRICEVISLVTIICFAALTKRKKWLDI